MTTDPSDIRARLYTNAKGLPAPDPFASPTLSEILEHLGQNSPECSLPSALDDHWLAAHIEYHNYIANCNNDDQINLLNHLVHRNYTFSSKCIPLLKRTCGVCCEFWFVYIVLPSLHHRALLRLSNFFPARNTLLELHVCMSWLASRSVVEHDGSKGYSCHHLYSLSPFML